MRPVVVKVVPALVTLLALGFAASAPASAAPLRHGRGWTQMAPAFPACQVITWSYSAKGEPRRAAGMGTDVTSSFRRISRATGITFRHVARGGRITLGWKDLGTRGPDGEGGPTWRGEVAISGSVVFNTRSQWVTVAGFEHAEDGFPGRGALITHETGHALGLGHVDDPDQLMYPVATNGSPTVLQKGDTTGLRTLYRPSAC